MTGVAPVRQEEGRRCEREAFVSAAVEVEMFRKLII